MPSYLAPGVYVEEVSSGTKPIAGVGTSTAGFIGVASRGPTDIPRMVTSYAQFEAIYGGPIDDHYLASSVYGFFAEGGSKCYIARVISEGTGTATINLQPTTGTEENGTITAHPGAHGELIDVVVENMSLEDPLNYTDFAKISVFYDGKVVEVFSKVSTSSVSENLVESNYVVINLTKAGPIKRMTYALTGGTDGEEITNADLTGGWNLLAPVDEISLLVVPDVAILGDAAAREAIKLLIGFCKTRGDIFCIADLAKGDSKKAASIGTWRKEYGFESYGALYAPWVYVLDPKTGSKKLIPPSGLVAGRFAYTDSTRGVHKAPAGTQDGQFRSVVGVEVAFDKPTQEIYNPKGVNIIRSFADSGIVIWGARTTSSDPEWNYVNVRRLFLFIEESIDEATQWAVFEPNDSRLWGKVNRNVTSFLTRVWRDGALVGNTPDQAFFVKVNADNNPKEVVEAGQLIIEIGVAPVRPAEFVVFRVTQKTMVLN